MLRRSVNQWFSSKPCNVGTTSPSGESFLWVWRRVEGKTLRKLSTLRRTLLLGVATTGEGVFFRVGRDFVKTQSSALRTQATTRSTTTRLLKYFWRRRSCAFSKKTGHPSVRRGSKWNTQLAKHLKFSNNFRQIAHEARVRPRRGNFAGMDLLFFPVPFSPHYMRNVEKRYSRLFGAVEKAITQQQKLCRANNRKYSWVVSLWIMNDKPVGCCVIYPKPKPDSESRYPILSAVTFSRHRDHPNPNLFAVDGVVSRSGEWIIVVITVEESISGNSCKYHDLPTDSRWIDFLNVTLSRYQIIQILICCGWGGESKRRVNPSGYYVRRKHFGQLL